MADNTPVPEGSSKPPPLSPGEGGVRPPPLPSDKQPNKKTLSGKLMVMLSSVAKSAPSASAPPPLPVNEPSAPLMGQPLRPPVVPSKMSPEDRQKVTMPLMPYPAGGASQSAGATEVILPRKTDQLPRLSSPSVTPITMPPVVKKDVVQDEASPVKEPVSSAKQAAKPPPLPAKRPEPAQSKSVAGKIDAIAETSKIKPPPLNPTASEDSIFLPEENAADVEKPPADWKHLEPGELPPAEGGLQSLEAFSRSQRPVENGALAKAIPPVIAKAPEPVLPPPLPPAKPAEKPVSSPMGQVPPLLEKSSGSQGEKLHAPHLPPEIGKEERSTKEPAKPMPDPVAPVSKSQQPAPATKREKSIPLFLFPPAKPKAKPPTPATAADSPTIKVEESKPVLKAPPLPTKVPGAPAKPPLVNPSATAAMPPPVSISTAKAPAPTASAPPAAKAPPSLPTKVPGAPAKPPLVNPSATTATPAPVSISAAKKPATSAFTLPVSKASPDKPTVPNKSVKPAPASSAAKATSSPSTPLHAPKKLEEPPVAPPVVAATTQTRSARARKRNKVETIVFYLIYFVTLILLYIGALYFGRETRVEGQVIPPPNTTLGNEAWIVGDFRTQAFGITDDLAGERTPKLERIQEAQTHVQRAQADIAAREERIRLVREQVQAAKDEIASTIKQAHDAAQQIWDSTGAQLEDEYNSRLNQMQKLFVDRAKALNLKYQPDDTYHSPEVWANAYRLALYDMPAGVDSAKEHQWLEDQMKQWRDFTKSIDDRQKQLREQAAQIQLATTPKVSDLNGQVDELQRRVDGTLAEEEPLKAELQQSQLDLSKAQADEAGLDDKYYKQLYSLPEGTITKHLPLTPTGRFSWRHVEKDNPFAEGEKKHHYYLLVRAIRPDGRQYWAFLHLDLVENDTLPVAIEPSDFITTKSILRPDLSPEEQQQ